MTHFKNQPVEIRCALYDDLVKRAHTDIRLAQIKLETYQLLKCNVEADSAEHRAIYKKVYTLLTEKEHLIESRPTNDKIAKEYPINREGLADLLSASRYFSRFD